MSPRQSVPQRMHAKSRDSTRGAVFSSEDWRGCLLGASVESRMRWLRLKSFPPALSEREHGCALRVFSKEAQKSLLAEGRGQATAKSLLRALQRRRPSFSGGPFSSSAMSASVSSSAAPSCGAEDSGGVSAFGFDQTDSAQRWLEDAEEVLEDWRYSARAGDLEAFQKALSDAKSLETRRHSLLRAASSRDFELLSSARLPLDVNFQDSDGNTALHFAAANGHCDIAEFIVRSGEEHAFLRLSLDS